LLLIADCCEMSVFDYSQMNLVPRRCIVESRSQCNTSVDIGGRRFTLPIVPANMECVIDTKLAVKLASAGYFYIMHRFANQTLAFAETMKKHGLPISISVGVGKESYDVLEEMLTNNLVPDYITIDVAHGHADSVQKMIGWIHTNLPSHVYIIAGNVSTAEAVRDLENWGADAIKVGIGPGSACTTYNVTGFGSRGVQASVVKECAAAACRALIIADGGIKDPGDIAKSLALGAGLVMVGGMFSALVDSPGNTVELNGRQYKEFWGSASVHATGKKDRIEGTKNLVPMKSRGVLEEMSYLTECLQSAISYGGGRDVTCLSDVTWIIRS
jgi:GMP reductase